MNKTSPVASALRSFPKLLVVVGVVILIGVLIYVLKPIDQKPVDSVPPKPSALVGQVFKDTVSGINENGEGFIKLPDFVVAIPGVDIGQHIEFRITDDTGRFVRAELIRTLPSAAGYSPPPVTKEENRPAPVKVGDVIDVEVTEADRRHPEENGVARINGFVVFVPGTKVGERVKIRITKVMDRAADSAVVERLGALPGTP